MMRVDSIVNRNKNSEGAKNMKKKSLMVVLILVILLTSTGIVHAEWGIKANKFGPIVIQGHPWGEFSSSTSTPPSYKAGSGSGFDDCIGTPSITNFVLRFYYDYIVKRANGGQRSVKKND
jgi:hypothetical protein